MFQQCVFSTANLCAKILDFTGFDSSIISILRDGIPRPIGTFPESLIQAILVGIILVGRLGVDSDTYVFVPTTPNTFQHAVWKLHTKLESTNPSRDNLGRETGRSLVMPSGSEQTNT